VQHCLTQLLSLSPAAAPCNSSSLAMLHSAWACPRHLHLLSTYYTAPNLFKLL
jgi:hypothetical protein